MLAIAAMPLLAACTGNPFGGVVCTDDARPGVIVQLRQAPDGSELSGPATVIVRDGTYADTAHVPAGMSSAGLAHERAGVYEVVVRKFGYTDWKRAGVAVEDGECHVRTVRLRADLQPTPQG
ncbi:MAG TPA: hypothetical protein VGR37_00775 [Longimicrobiaceae bacterium]|nr:hypothetical protein [Longimicrobiaceae bacterium]